MHRQMQRFLNTATTLLDDDADAGGRQVIPNALIRYFSTITISRRAYA